MRKTSPSPSDESSIMVVDDDVYLLAAIRQTLTLNKYHTLGFDRPTDALAALDAANLLAIIADVKMPGMNGLEFLRRVRERDADLPVIMITGHGDVEMAVRAMKDGAYDFLEKPVDEDVLLASLSRAVEKMRLVLDNRALEARLRSLKEQRTECFGLVGRHPLMQRLYDTITLLAREEEPVLVSGETGTGKELVARAIHEGSARRGKPFVTVNMGAIPADMLEAELFGYEKGAFTGATQTKPGKFEFAKDGTLFLDEICSLPVNLQAKLLRVLEDRSFCRLGANTPIVVRARIITATNSDLEEAIAAGRFRQDLYFRLNVLPVSTPALRDHKDDIPLLIRHFCSLCSPDRGLDQELLRAPLFDQLLANEWPGNVRELKNFVKRFCVYGSEGLRGGAEVPATKPCANGDAFMPRPLRDHLDEVEKQHILAALRFSRGLVSDACRVLGVSRKCLYDKTAKHRIDLAALREGCDKDGVNDEKRD